jgi:hypothetical protein
LNDETNQSIFDGFDKVAKNQKGMIKRGGNVLARKQKIEVSSDVKGAELTEVCSSSVHHMCDSVQKVEYCHRFVTLIDVLVQLRSISLF